MVRNRSHNIIVGFLLVGIFTANLFAIPAFTEGIVSSSADGVWGVHVADVDGDGNLDIIRASLYDDTVAWYENTANGYTGHVITTSANGAIAVYAEDIDSDGDMDILSANYYEAKIVWYENNGSESFTAHTISTSMSYAYDVYAADIDLDGDMDVIGASYSSDKVVWFENNGSESFTSHTVTTAADGAASVYVEDVDSDGDMDILSASINDDEIAWYENNGSESFTMRTITTGANGANTVFAIDVDSDGDMDVLSSSSYDDKIAWYENNGSQGFTARTISTTADGAFDLYALDFDQDGDVDVLSASLYDHEITLYENNGSQTFAAYVIATAVNGTRSVYAGDMDNDGDTDIIATALNDDRVIVYTNETSGLATASFVASTISTTANGARSVFAADMDNDGDIDIVSASQEDDAIAWYENNGAANPSWTASDIATSANGAVSLFVADMDADGDMDIVSTSELDDAIAWYENDGAANPSWTASDIATSADGARSVFAADLDNDGDMDLISASANDNTIAWYENDGAVNPSWTAADISTSASAPFSVFVADMDNDGDLDIVSASINNDAIAWYENNGAANPSWTAVDIATSADAATSVSVADMDNDGDMDIISASINDDAIAWYENDGAANSSWTATDIATSADGAQSVFAADMDNDGDMDIVSASYQDDKIAWYQNSAGRNAPQITSVTSTQDNGSYGVGTEIPIFVNYSDQVLVTGTPQLTLETGSTDAVLNYVSGSGTGQLLFTYTVAPGHASADLDYQSSSALSLNGGTIKDARGNNNNASLTLPAPGVANSLGANKNLVIDTNAPTVTNVTSTTADGTYGTGDTINVSVTFNDTVDVTTGTIGCGDFLISSLPFSAQYSNAGQPNNWDVSGSDGSDIAYTLNLSEATTISITTCAAYSNYDTKLQIFTANDQCTPVATSYYNDDYSCTYSGLRASLPSCALEAGQYYVVVDGYSGATGNYQVDISVVSGRNSSEQNTTDMNLPGMDDYPRFANTVGYDSEYEITKLRADGYMYWEVDEFLNDNDVDPIYTLRSGGTGIPKITLETGAGDSVAYYVSGHGTNIISFQYIVTTGDSSSDLDYVSVDALDVNSGTIRDASGNDATLTLSTPGATGSLSANKALVIDGFGPLVSSVSSTAADSVYDVGSVIPITILFNENVVISGTPQLTMETGASDAIASYVSGSGSNTITFNYTTTAGENSADLDYQDSTALISNGGTITDAYGNAANLILPAPGAEGSLGANKAIIIDGGAPVVNNITSTSSDGTYNLGDVIPITVSFSEALTVTGTPQLEINTGGTSLSFDGNGDYVRMAGFNPSTTDFTLSLWVKSNAYSSSNKNIFQQMDVSGNGRSIIYVRRSSNQFATFLGGGERLSGVVSEVNRWYNVVLVHNNSANTITWFIDGVQANTNNSNVETTVGDFLLGVHKGFGSSSYFNGLMDEIAIWNSQLDSTEIVALYNSGASISAAANSGNYTSSSDLMRYYTMDEGLGNVVVDHSSSEVNGALYNGTWGPSPLRGDVVNYSSGSGTSSLTFNYIVSNGHYSTDLDYTRPQALLLNGGTIKEASGNDAVLTMPLPGTIGSLGYAKAINVDGVVPVVTSVTSTTNDGAYSLEENISITISFDDLITVTGTPQLTLETGSIDATADYSSGTGTDLLTFTYTVATGDTSSDLGYAGVNALSLNSGTMRDASGNNVNLMLPSPGDSLSLSGSKALVVDGVLPSVINVTSSMNNGFYNVGDTLDISVQFNENMTVGTASLGCGDFLITSLPYTHSYYTTGQGNNWDVSGSDNEDVAYTLHLLETTTISVTTCNSGTNYDSKLQIFTANGQCVGTSAGYYNDDYSCSYNNLYATLPSSQLSAGTYYIVVDGYSSRNGNYTVSVEDISSRATAVASDYDSQYEIDKLLDDGYQQWEIRDMIADQNVDEPTYSFSRTGTGIPQLTLETGSIDGIATYSSGDGNTSLSFRYIVGMGQNSNDLDYASTTALELNGGTITDAAGNAATLTLPTPGGIGSLGANKDIIIDGGVPQVTSVTSSISDGNYITGDLIPIDVVFTENVTVTDTPQIQLSTGGYALDLDGSDDYAFIPNHSSLQFGTNDYSISVWFNIDAIGATRQIFCKRGGPGNYEIQVNSAGRLSAWAPTGFSGSTILTANTWYNVVLTRVNGTAYLYLNGVLEASRSSSGTQSSSNGLSIGRDSYGGERFNGDIDEFAIWNNGLSAGEALTLYNGNASLDLTSNSSNYTSSSNLVMYLRLNEGSGNSSIDATGNGHDATLNNGATWAVSQLGGTVVNYSLGSGTDTLTFNYTVVDGNFSIDLDYTNTNALILNGGIIRDNGGNNAILTLPGPGSLGSLSANKNIVVDGSVPAITNVSSSNADGVYIIGDTLVIGVTFSDIINVTGVPQLSLNLGNVDGIGEYASGTGTTILNFQYVVFIGQTSSDLDYDSTTSLLLNNGTINDQSGNRAVLILPDPGSSGSLAYSKALQVDGIVPIIDSVSTYAINGIYSTGDTMDISVSFNENVIVTGVPQLSLETGDTDVLVNYRSGSGSSTLMFRYMVGLGNSSNDLDYTDTTALTLNGGSIRDISGNNATLTLIPPGSTGSLSANKALVVDGGAPIVESVTSPSTNSTYIVGDTILTYITFSELVIVSGAPTLTLETGDNDAISNYTGGSGTTVIKFSYIVSEGHYSDDLGYVNQNALELNQGSISDAAGNNMVLLLPEPDSTGSLSFNKNLIIDGILPFVNSVSSLDSNGTYIFGDTVDISIDFSEQVNIAGSPQLILETGSNDVSIPYLSGTGSTTLVFRYIIESGQSSLDLGYQTDSSLVLNGGSINDFAGNRSLLILPEIGSTFSISGSSDIYVDGDVPNTPTNLIATPGLGKVDLTWTENTETDLAYYKVYADTVSSPSIYIGDGFVGLQKFSHNNITDGSIRYYRISAVDLAGNESNKTSTVFAMPHDPVNEQCLSFDGDDDYIDTPLASNLLPLTISVLFKPDVNSGEQSIIDSDIGGRYGQSIILGYQDQDNSVDVQYHNGFYDSPFTYSPDKWYHAVAVYDTGIVLLYMNGELVGSETFTQEEPDGSNFRIGRHNSGDPQWYDGKIDEVIIWNDTLNLNEIHAINSDPLNINLNENSDQYQSSSSLLGYWKFGESTGRTVYDISGNGNHATINGATWDSEAVDMVPPGMPENLVADAGNRQITLSWNKNQEEDLYQYLIYGGMEQFPSNIVARNSNPNDTTVVIDSLENGSTYYYRISAIDYSGLESQKTLDVSATPTPQKYEINQNGAGDFISIQSAINQSFNDDTLIVFSGTYNENIDLLGKALIIASEYFISADTSHISSTIIDGQSNGPVITISNSNSSQIKLVGLTIQNGSAQYGGAVYSINSNLFLESLIILNNNSTANGGGLYLYGGNPNLSSITLSNNTATAYGGAIYMQNNSSAILNKLTIDNNSAENGAGIAMSSSNPTITNLVLSNNNADSTGGAIAMYSNSNPGLYNIVIHNNYAGQYGGAIYSTNSNATIGNSTIVDNQSEFHGGALNLSDGSNVEAINSILYHNVPDQMYISDINDLLSISYSNIEGGLYGIGYSHETSSSSESLVSWDSSNIDINPLFNNINNYDYRLSDYSMSIGVGDISSSFSVDMNGVNRPAPQGTAPDLGAYENLRSVPDVWLTLVNDQFFMNEDSDLLFNPVSNDSIVNFHLVNLAILDSADHGSIQIMTDSTIIYQPDENYFGKDTIIYAFDNAERRDSAITIITIYMLDDDPPVITSSSTSFAVEDQIYNYTYEGYDPDMSTNRWEILNAPEWLVMINDSISGIPLEGDLDTSFLLIYYDSYFSDTLDVGIFVTTVNDPPEIKSPDSIIVDESEYYVYRAFADDPEDSTLLWTFNNLPSWMNTTGDSTFGSPNEGAQDTSFQIIVSDGEYLDTVLVFVEVIPYNDLPVITSSDSLLAIEDEFVSFNFAGYDPEGLPISWLVDYLPSWLSMEGDDVSGIPLEGDLDTIFTLYASDGLLNDSLQINVYVNPVNDLPTITSHVIDTAFVDEYFVYYPSAIDPEDSTLTWELYDGPSWMTLIGDSIHGMVSRGSDDTFFTIIVSDGELTDTMIVYLEVIDINYPPEITFMSLQGEYHNNVNLSLHLYDFDDDELDYQISYTTDGVQWNEATTIEQSGSIGLDTMSIIWYSMADLNGSFHPNVQLKILAYDLQSDTLQTPEDTSSTYISDVFAIDNYIGSVTGVMGLTQDEYYGNIRLAYSITDTTNDYYTVILRYSINNGNSWNLASLQDSLYNIGSLEYSDTLIWNSDDDLFNLDTNLLLELSVSDEWQSTSSELISIHFDNQVLPLLTEISPDTGEYIYWYDHIILTFTGQMDLNSYSNGIILQSNQRGVLDYTAQFIQEGEVAHLTIYPEENYYADERIQVSINQQLRDIWNNPFDGNNNGDPDGAYDHDSLSFSINVLGDYDRSGLVDFEDLVSFQQYWWSDTTMLSHEVGPALGEPPYMQLHPDNLMNFEDLMVFVQMWNWSNGFENDGGGLARNMIYDKYNASFSVGYPDKKIGKENDYLFLNLNLDSIRSIGSIGIEFLYDPEIIQFIDQSSRLDQSWTSLLYHDSINHRIMLQVADLDKEQRIQPINKQFKFTFKKLMDADTEIEWIIDMRNRLGQVTQIFTQSYQFNTIAPLPEVYALHQNYPNPFNPTTTIRYDLPEDSNIRISIYNLLGQEVKLLTNKFEAAGYRTMRWHGKDNFNQDVSAGIYFLLMETNNFTSTRKLILLK